MDKKHRFGLRKTTMGLVSAMIMGVTVMPLLGAGQTVFAESDDESKAQEPALISYMPDEPLHTLWTANTVDEIDSEINAQLAEQTDSKEYVIQWGDTVWGITQAFDLDQDAFVEANDIENPDLIYADDTVTLDVTQAVAEKESSESDKSDETDVAANDNQTETDDDKPVVSEDNDYTMNDSTVSPDEIEEDKEDKETTSNDDPKPSETDNETDRVEKEENTDQTDDEVVSNENTDKDNTEKDEVITAPPALTTPDTEKPDASDQDDDKDNETTDKPDKDEDTEKPEDNTDKPEDNTGNNDGNDTGNDDSNVDDSNDTTPEEPGKDEDTGDTGNTDDNEPEEPTEPEEPEQPTEDGETTVDPGGDKNSEIVNVEIIEGETVEVPGDVPSRDGEVLGEEVVWEKVIEEGNEDTPEIRKVRIARTRGVKHGIVYEANPENEAGVETVKTEGVDGEVRDTIEKEYQDDALMGEALIGSEITKDVINKVIDFGTARIDTKVETEHVTEPFDTIYTDDYSLEKGETRVVTEGVNGLVENIRHTKSKNGNDIGEPVLKSTKILKEKVDKEVIRGMMVVETKTEKKQVSTKPETVWVDNPDLEEGVERVKQEGKNKVVEITYSVRFENGKETSRKEVSRTTIAKGQNTIMERGTKKAESDNGSNDPFKDIKVDLKQFNVEMLKLINAERTRIGVKPLEQSSILEQGVAVRADELLEPGGYSHTRPNGERFSTAFEYLTHDPDAKKITMGENIAQSYVPIDAIEDVEAGKSTMEYELAEKFYFMYRMSEDHYANMMSEDFTGFATNIRIADDYKMFNVQVFENGYIVK